MNLYILEYQGMFANGMITVADVSVESLVRNLKGHLRWFFMHQQSTHYQLWDWFEDGEGGYRWGSIFNEEEFNANFDEDFRLVPKKYATLSEDEQEENVWSVESEFELRIQIKPGVYNFAFKRTLPNGR